MFQLLGFTKFFKIADDLDSALGTLEGGGVGMSEAEKQQPGGVAYTDDSDETEAGMEPAPVFPLVFECPHCAKKLKALKPGKYRCSGCSGIIKVDELGVVAAA